MRITKTNYLAFKQCAKQLWLESYHADWGEPPDDAGLRRLREGQKVDRQARKQFPEGILIRYRPKPTDMIPLTQQAIDRGKTTLFQATFGIDDLLVKADILTQTRAGWHLIEVKSATEVKPEYLPDAAFQTYVLRQAGLDVVQVSIMHLNKACIAPDLRNLFTIADVTAEVEALQAEVAEDVVRMREVLDSAEFPPTPIGKQCHKPYDCPFIPYCWRDINGLTIFDVPYLKGARLERLKNEGVVLLEDISAESSLTPNQRAFVERITQKQIAIDRPAVQKALSGLVYPLYFFDFETIDYALPRFADSRPNQKLPFQYSCHILHEDGNIEHVEFLHEGQDDPRPPLVERLLTDLGTTGSIIVYSAPFERKCLQELAAQFPQYAGELGGFIGRLWDQLDIFKKHYRDYRFGKSNSLKSVLPVVVPSLSYKTLDVQDGVAAQVAWQKMVAEPDPTTAHELAQQLRAYCALDTWAMVKIHEHLQVITSISVTQAPT